VQRERNLEALCRYDGSILIRAENSLLEEAGKLVDALSPGVSRIGRSEPDTGCRCRGAWHGSGSGSRRRSEPPIEVWAVSHRRGTRLSPEASGMLRRRTGPTPSGTRSSSRPDEARTSPARAWRPGGVFRPRRSDWERSPHRRWTRFPSSSGRRSQPSSSRTTIWRKPVVQPLWQACRKSRTPPLRPVHRPSRCGRHCRCRAPGSRPGRRSLGCRSEVVRGLAEDRASSRAGCENIR